MPARNVIISDNISQSLQQLFATYAFSQVGVLVDENTYRDCYPLIQPALPAHTLHQIRSGELHKNLTTCEGIWTWLTHQGFDRKALLINLGGGVIGDMGGFCAGTYKRGIRFVNLPTTLLSQVDASVGGKLGIDFLGFKNHIGLFQEPLQVIISPHFLQTLPARELRSGFAEVVKHSLIADADYWSKITAHSLETQPWPAHITHSVNIKSAVVEQDFREGGLRKILNFGHTIGHAIESFYLETDAPLLHGEAIAVGMICESYLSEKYCALHPAEVKDIVQFITKVFGKVALASDAIKTIADMAQQDKKNENNHIQCTLLEQIGKATYDVPISEEDIRQALLHYQATVS